MTPVEILSVVATGISIAAFALNAIDKLPFVQSNKSLKTWIDDANDIAGELKLIVPMGSTVAQVKGLAETRAAAVVEKYSGGVTQAEVVTQVMGEFARIVQSGHIIPASLAPTESAIMAELANIKALIATQAAPAPAPAPAKPMMSAEMAAALVSPSAEARVDASHVPLAG